MGSTEIMLVDDEPGLLRAASRALALDGLGPVLECADGHAALGLMEARAIGAMVIDLSMPGMGGQELLGRVRADYPDVPVIVMTGSGDLQVAVQCMQQGAVDYLAKPVPDERLCSAVRRALALRAQHAELVMLRDGLLRTRAGLQQRFPEILTQDAAMLGIFRYLEAIAASPSAVLVGGETGTGKELVARALHRLSRRPGPLVTVNVGALDDSMFSDTLFGHARGAYTNAVAARAGLVQSAADGTLFLDEIGELEQRSQVKLLRLLEDGSYEQLGSDQPRRSRARIVVATHRDLADDVAAGRFRKDLYYRLRTHVVGMPPLRERLGDLPLLVPHFLAQAAGEMGKPVPTEPPALYQLLRTHDFPGNLRELRDLCRDAVARHEGRVLSMRCFREHVDAAARAAGGTPPAHAPGAEGDEAGADAWLPYPLPTMAAADDALVREAMRRAGDNQGVAAHMLDISRQALNRRVLSLRRRGAS